MPKRKAQFTSATHARIRVLKCRETGETGEADLLNYDRETGRLVLASVFPMDDNQPEKF